MIINYFALPEEYWACQVLTLLIFIFFWTSAVLIFQMVSPPSKSSFTLVSQTDCLLKSQHFIQSPPHEVYLRDSCLPPTGLPQFPGTKHSRLELSNITAILMCGYLALEMWLIPTEMWHKCKTHTRFQKLRSKKLSNFHTDYMLK